MVADAIGKEFPFSEARDYTDIAAQRKSAMALAIS